MVAEERLRELREEAYADDVSIPKGAHEWTEDDAVEYFLSGGTRTPNRAAAQTDHAVWLHGTASNEDILRVQCAKLIRALAPTTTHVLEGSRLVDRRNPHATLMRRHFGEAQLLREYCEARSDAQGRRTYDADELSEAIGGLERRIAALPGGAPVLLGFSQGANLACVLAARAEARAAGAPQPYRCVVLLNPARPGYMRHAPPGPYLTPVLVIGGGVKDTVVGEGPREVAALFENARVVEHGEGHRPLPSDPSEAERVCAAIAQFVRPSR